MEIVVFAPARPETMAIIYFALAFCFTLLRISTDGRPMAAPTATLFKNTSSFRFFNTHIRGGAISNLLPLCSDRQKYNYDCHRADGQWPPLRVGDLKLICHLENGNVPTASAGYNRDTAITTSTI